MSTLGEDGVKPEIIGKVTDKQTVEIKYGNKRMILT